MIWFGNLPGLQLPPPVRGRVPLRERDRMRSALEWVAARAPHLTGDELLDALAETGWIDRDAAARLLPEFRHFNPDRCFAEHMRRLSFRGLSAADDFRAGLRRIVEDLTGHVEDGSLGTEHAFRFRSGEQEGILLGYPEVSLSIGGNLRPSIAAAVDEMPDALVIVARNFQQGAAEQLASLLSRTGVPGTLITVNLLLGMRASTLRYQPPLERVLGLLGAGRPLRSADVAVLGERR